MRLYCELILVANGITIKSACFILLCPDIVFLFTVHLGWARSFRPTWTSRREWDWTTWTKGKLSKCTVGYRLLFLYELLYAIYRTSHKGVYCLNTVGWPRIPRTARTSWASGDWWGWPTCEYSSPLRLTTLFCFTYFPVHFIDFLIYTVGVLFTLCDLTYDTGASRATGCSRRKRTSGRGLSRTKGK